MLTSDHESTDTLTTPTKPRFVLDPYRFPWWALMLLLLFVFVIVSVSSDEDYARVFEVLSDGIFVTLQISVFGYILALFLGLLTGLVRSYPPQRGHGLRNRIRSIAHLIAYHIATMYVEIMRGLPVVIVILVTAFVITPAVRRFLEATYGIVLEFRSASVPTVALALGLAYGAYLSEIFRAGIQSIEKGQIEASRALGMGYFRTMRFVVLPQAIRRVLPTLGNDFVAIIKDSSLAAFVGVQEITRLANTWSGSTFKYVETYLVVSMIYLFLTITGSILVQLMERRLKYQER